MNHFFGISFFVKDSSFKSAEKQIKFSVESLRSFDIFITPKCYHVILTTTSKLSCHQGIVENFLLIITLPSRNLETFFLEQ